MSVPQVLSEREKELDLLTGVLEDVESSGGRMVLIRGEAGIGKTALVRGFLESIGDTAHVLFGRCDDLVTPRPLAPFWDMARQESLLRQPLQDGDRWGLMETILDLLERSLRPTIAVVEDTHWADEATLDAITYLGRRVGGANGLLLLTYRDGEVDFDHPMRRVIGALSPERVVRIRLGGLSRTAVSSLLADSHLDSEHVYTATDGNPFLVTEMVAGSPDAVPSSVQDSVMTRVKRMSLSAQELLETLSVLPEPIAQGELLGLVGEVGQTIAECEQRGLLEVDNEFIWFRHELIRQAIEKSLPASERMVLNQTVLDSLSRDADPARLAHHAREAGDVDAILLHAPAAAQAASAVGSHREAVDHFRQLDPHLDLLAPEVRASLLEDWAWTERIAGYMIEACARIDQALILYRGRADRAGVARTLVSAGYYHEWAGERRRAEEYARQAMEALGSNPDGTELARALELNAFLAGMSSDVPATLDLVERTLEAAGPGIDEWTLVRCLNHRGIALNMARYPDGLETLDEAREHARAAGLWIEEGRALYNHAWFAAEVRDLAGAEDHSLRALDVLKAHEESSAWSYASLTYAIVLELKGEWEQAEDTARELTEDFQGFAHIEALPLLGKVEARQGRKAATKTVNRAWELAVNTGEYQRLSRAADALAEYAWISGSEGIPVSEISEVMEEGLRIGWGWSAGSIAFWLWKLDELIEVPEGIAGPYQLVLRGEPLAAAQTWVEIGCPYERAIALSHGDTDAQFDALEILETLGATAVAAKLRQELRERGVPVPRGRARETREHPVGLTARQDEVLSLLAEGLSNAEVADRLFLSPRTVEHHVAAVMSKLNVSSREQAVAAAEERELLAAR